MSEEPPGTTDTLPVGLHESRGLGEEGLARPLHGPSNSTRVPFSQALGLEPMEKNLFSTRDVKYELRVGVEEGSSNLLHLCITANSSGLSPSMKMQDKDRGQEGKS